MRHTEFWARLDATLGRAYSRTWAELTVVRDLDGRTTQEARDAGGKGGLASHPRRKEMVEGEGGTEVTPSGGDNITGGGDSRNEQLQ